MYRDTPGRSLALLLGYDVTTKIDPFSSRPISRDEAFCLLAHAPRIAFLGDSLTRFHFFTLNEWLSTGKLQTHLYSKWGNGDGSIHYDTSDRWTHTSFRVNTRSTLRRPFHLPVEPKPCVATTSV